MTPATTSGEMRSRTLDGTERAHALWQAAAHLSNHQTHHRGQLTTLYSQHGIDPGVTDLLAMPGYA